MLCFCKWSNLWSKHFVGIFLKMVTAEKVNVFKGFQRFKKLTAGNCLHAPKAGALPTALHPEKYKWSLSEHSRSALLALAGRVVAACYSQARSRGSPLGGVSLRENTAPWCFHLLTQSRRATNCATPRLCLPCIISCFIIIAKAREKVKSAEGAC